jgi:hypothetical protein
VCVGVCWCVLVCVGVCWCVLVCVVPEWCGRGGCRAAALLCTALSGRHCGRSCRGGAICIGVVCVMYRRRMWYEICVVSQYMVYNCVYYCDTYGYGVVPGRAALQCSWHLCCPKSSADVTAGAAAIKSAVWGLCLGWGYVLDTVATCVCRAYRLSCVCLCLRMYA